MYIIPHTLYNSELEQSRRGFPVKFTKKKTKVSYFVGKAVGSCVKHIFCFMDWKSVRIYYIMNL